MVDASVLLLVAVHRSDFNLGDEGDVVLRGVAESVESGVVNRFEGLFEFLHPFGMKGVCGSKKVESFGSCVLSDLRDVHLVTGSGGVSAV